MSHRYPAVALQIRLSGREVRERARFAARTGGEHSPMAALRERLYAYLELDSYLASQGIGSLS